MAAFEISFSDRIERVDDADGYDLEGPLTTFFRSDRGHGTLDSWSVRIASFRSADVRAVRRLEVRGVATSPIPLILDEAV